MPEVETLLPGANCGACGMKGCHDFAVQCVREGNLDKYFCPGAGKDGMAKIAAFLGCESSDRDPNVAVVKCGGTSVTKTAFNATYVGPRTCSIMNMTAGDYDCDNSCLGCGDCADACQWHAISINHHTGLAEVDADLCTGCGQCVTTCPRKIISLRPQGVRGRRVWVACSNCQKGPVTRKQCKAGCIACGLCVKACPFGAITIVNNLARIDPSKCKTCGKCVPVCPAHAIKCANMIIKQKDEAINV